MPTPLAPWTARCLEVLADGCWHTLDELVDAAGPLIPPGRAEREAEHQRIRMLNQRGTGPRPRDPGQRWADPIDSGRRAIVRHALIGLVRGRRIERMPNAEDLVAYRLTRSSR